VYKVLVREGEGKKPLGTLRHGWEIGLGAGWSGFSWLRIGTGDGLLEMW
jgi:hypothetical protein